jgi:hypothetical protein
MLIVIIGVILMVSRKVLAPGPEDQEKTDNQDW